MCGVHVTQCGCVTITEVREQLSEVMYAYQNHLEEAEVQELLDANLPPEEMHGIINVVAAAKGGEE